MTRTARAACTAALLGLAGLPAAAAECSTRGFEGQTYTVCDVTLADDLRLFQTAPDGEPYRTFDRINDALAAQGESLGFAMNAGMYHPDRSPVGLMIEDGVERSGIVTSAGPGNFGMLPNGVFCVGDRFRVVESRQFAKELPTCRFASQSGPMLVIDGRLHPRFLPDSDSRNLRNGVGVTEDGSRAFFVISEGEVNFAQFARFFRDELKTPDALYFDGSISRLHAPELGRSDIGFPMGPIVGTVVAAD